VGTTLALVYAERYPHRVSEIVLSAISTTRRSEIDWLYRGVGRFFPEKWDRFRFARLCAHYFSHAAWLEEGAVIRDAGRLAGIPGVLIHGRQDLSCPADTAWELARAWPGVELLVDDQSGHRGSPVKRAWVLGALDRFSGS
jgi:proline iminopeptidase